MSNGADEALNGAASLLKVIEATSSKKLTFADVMRQKLAPVSYLIDGPIMAQAQQQTVQPQSSGGYIPPDLWSMPTAGGTQE